MTLPSASSISEGGIIVKRSMVPVRQSSSRAAMVVPTMPSWMRRTRVMSSRALFPLFRHQSAESERPAQIFVEQALVDQPAPVKRLLDLAYGDEAVDHGGQSLFREIAAAPVLPFVILWQDSIGLGRGHLPDLGIDARGLGA